MQVLKVFTEEQFEKAVEEITVFIGVMAEKCKQDGWNFISTNDAPESFSELKKKTINKVIPVANYGCDKTIYPDHETNILFRFWHDVTHLELNESFSFNGECAVTHDHFDKAVNYGLSNLALSILWADTYGQVKYYYTHKSFVDNQKDFVYSCVKHGIKNTIQRKF